MVGRKYFSKVAAAQYIQKVQQQAQRIESLEHSNVQLQKINARLKEKIEELESSILERCR
jgi:cell division protein FtsB